MKTLVFLKLGGSLITDKHQPNTANKAIITRLVAEIHQVYQQQQGLQLILGHGSGSFGHHAAKKHQTRQGITTDSGWQGFVEVWQAAHQLNQIVLEICQAAQLPVIAFPPSAMVTARNQQFSSFPLENIQAALNAHLIPLVFGDVIFDLEQGATIFSTEEIFFHLAEKLTPSRILLAGIEEGVWQDYPACQHFIPEINSRNIAQIARSLRGSAAATDVTGGMHSKVISMLTLAQKIPQISIEIFSGLTVGKVASALHGNLHGTRIRA